MAASQLRVRKSRSSTSGEVVGFDGGDPGVEAVAVAAGEHLGECLGNLAVKFSYWPEELGR
jgi:hypothetical protein